MDNLPPNNASANIFITKAVVNAIFNQNKLNICHINVQSLSARSFSKFEELKLTFTQSKADIICFTETWLDNSIADSMICIEGYQLIRNDRNRRGGGICVYFRKGLQCRILEKSSNDQIPPNRSTEFLILDFMCTWYYIQPTSIRLC